MSVRTYAATALLAGASWLTVGVATPAFALCEVPDAYSGGCPSTPPGDGVGDTDLDGDTESPGSGTDTGSGTSPGGSGEAPGSGTPATGNARSTPTTLPFTGGELVLMTAIGVGALAGGTALAVAGRRRTHSPA
jgi:hypothetical protein